ncbi:PadR family transcriptional regulator [Thermoplasma sp. Kam2015]|uniref:PadR family transcriptional regulator n=1 Tax=Thermoplasma sp. Kam2015 TaxID=2094122 RepID=UPI000D9173BF|nr:PadR family transcriptional regulator [Thermoplasma sp. Kam2015]PYB67512.1 PadR family transcriptional regulator [Thermoplasma sp. Kam2015]
MFGGMRGPWGHHVYHSRGFVGIRYWILRILADGEKTGADIMATMENMSMGRWRPSPGAVYPLLRDMEDEGYIRSTERDNKKYYSLQEKGREMLEMLGAGPFYGRDLETSSIGDAIDRVSDYINYLKDNREQVRSSSAYMEKLKKLKNDIESILGW